MNQECADAWYATLQEYIADGGSVNGIVEWIADADRAKKVKYITNA
jgi:hypothetical protein